MHLFNLARVPACVANSESSKQTVQTQRMRAEIRNSGSEVELLIYDQIGEDIYGDGVPAESVVSFLKTNRTKPVNVRINSPGGLVYDGMVIYNALASHSPTVTVTIEGLAYSMASVIALAGDKMRMYKASDYGIHRAWGVAIGNYKDMQDSVDWLKTIDQHMVEIYAAKTGKSASQIAKWMDGVSDGTLFSAAEAKKHGFCDEIIDPKSEQSANRKTSNAPMSVQHAMNRLKIACM